MKRLLLVFYLLSTSVSAQVIQHPPADAPDPYTGWSSPVAGPCCARNDCGVAQRCTVDGKAGFVERGVCHMLPPDRYVEPPVSLAGNGDLHVCRRQTWVGQVYTPNVICWTDAFGL